MKNKINYIIVITIIAMMAVVSCKKENKNILKPTINYDTYLSNLNQYNHNTYIGKMNNIRIGNDGINQLYNTFKDKYKNYKMKLKSLDTTNLLIDTAIWQLKTCINTDLGFPFNVAHKTTDVFDTLSFSIIGYSKDSIPYIKGSDIYNEYDTIISNINMENNNGDSIYFWCTNMNVYKIDKLQAKVFITTMITFAYPYKRILPPGVYPDPFPYPTCKEAGNPYNPDNAAKNFENKYELEGPPNALPYGIVTLYDSHYLSHLSNNVGDRLWWHPGYNNEYLCVSPSGGGKLNDYLFSTKDVIDENNYSHDNIFLGNLNIYPTYISWNPVYGPHKEHIVEFYFYIITPINQTK